jgi:hypothetical protein
VKRRTFHNYARPDSLLCTRYISLLNLFNCDQIITEATRVTVHTSSVLDHIVTNSKAKIASFGTLNYGFSDHLAVFCTRATAKPGPFTPVVKRVRSLKNYSREVLCEELKSVNWTRVLLSNTVDDALGQFVTIFHEILDRVVPYRDVRFKQ